jgi:hypothetical protein
LGAGEGDLSERAGSAGRGALAGGIVGGAVPTVGTVVNAATQGIPGVRRSVGRVLEESVTPQAGARLRDLGPDAFLAEGSPTGMGYAQGVAIRPGPGKDVVVNAVTARHAGANARLGRELDDTLGPVMTPSAVEQSLEQQRLGLGPLYQQVTGLNQPVNLRPVYDQLRMAIPEEAGATQQALRRIMDMVAPQEGGQRIVRSAPREVLNVRQALDDEINRLGETPKAQRAVTEMRRLVDNALAEAVPDLKILDATFSNLSRESEALKRGSRVLQTGPEAIRPEELAAERAGMLAPQREAMRIGARAEIDRLVGTKANDATALKQLVQSEGDWNRTKLADIFGQAEADRILKAVDREVAFKDAYTKLVENSQTAQRQAAARKIGEDIDGAARAASLRDMTGIGLLASSLQKGKNALVDAFAGPTRQAADAELARVLMSTGPERDQWLRLIQSAQQKRSASSNTTRELLARAMYGGQPLDLDPAAILLGPHRPRPKRE